MTEADHKRVAGHRPTSGIPAHLTTHDGQVVEVSVAERGEDMLLVLLTNPGMALDEDDLTLESMTARGLVRLHGRAEWVTHDLVRFHVNGSEELIQRRQFVRVTAAQEVTLDDALGHVTDAKSVNISGGGMLVSGPEELNVDTEVKFVLQLEDGLPAIAGIGRVVRTAREDQRAIVFEHIADGDRDRLIHFIFDRQRRSLAMTRGDVV
jgi:PilZ domain-containing protein